MFARKLILRRELTLHFHDNCWQPSSAVFNLGETGRWGVTQIGSRASRFHVATNESEATNHRPRFEGMAEHKTRDAGGSAARREGPVFCPFPFCLFLGSFFSSFSRYNVESWTHVFSPMSSMTSLLLVSTLLAAWALHVRATRGSGAPIALPITDVQVVPSISDSLMKGIPAKIGTPPQNIVLLPWSWVDAKGLKELCHVLTLTYTESWTIPTFMTSSPTATLPSSSTTWSAKSGEAATSSRPTHPPLQKHPPSCRRAARHKRSPHPVQSWASGGWSQPACRAPRALKSHPPSRWRCRSEFPGSDGTMATPSCLRWVSAPTRLTSTPSSRPARSPAAYGPFSGAACGQMSAPWMAMSSWAGTTKRKWSGPTSLSRSTTARRRAAGRAWKWPSPTC